MKLDDGRLSFVAQQEVTALDAIHKAALGKAACAGRVTEGVGTCISIHAPTWGATEIVQCVFSGLIISIHAPTWGATLTPPASEAWPWISIHAPTWGATGDVPESLRKLIFQSTHPRGVRRSLCELAPSCAKFQSTHPRGVRRGNTTTIGNLSGFQSTHPRGVRPYLSNAKVNGALFQSTHPRGVRLRLPPRTPTFWNFNPRTHVGCDIRTIFNKAIDDGFQSTHPRGVRPHS